RSCRQSIAEVISKRERVWRGRDVLGGIDGLTRIGSQNGQEGVSAFTHIGHRETAAQNSLSAITKQLMKHSGFEVGTPGKANTRRKIPVLRLIGRAAVREVGVGTRRACQSTGLENIALTRFTKQSGIGNLRESSVQSFERILNLPAQAAG